MNALISFLSRKSTKAGLITGLCFLVLVCASCGDDDDGPSTRDLLIGTWELEEINGSDLPPGNSFEVTLEADGDYEEEGTLGGSPFNFRGEWELDGDVIEVEYDDGDFVEIEIESITADRLEADIEGDEWVFEKD